MIDRPEYISQIIQQFAVHPVVAILGPRQSGKTTLSKMFASGKHASYFDLENPIDLQKLTTPMQTLSQLDGLIVIDEFQRKPELLEIIRVIVDRPATSVQFLILGSASPTLIRESSESLAGRVGFVDLNGFSLDEVSQSALRRLWLRGGFPRSFLASDDRTSMIWRNAFVRTFLERDIPQLGITIPSETLRRFWTMIAHYHGQVWNGSELARSMGTSEHTVRRYLDILAGAYVVRILSPWYVNIKKRQVKSPKIFIRDSGILHALLGLSSELDLLGHPKAGSSWEGYALEQFVILNGLSEVYFWRTHAGAELDLLYFDAGRPIGVEFKLADAPGMTKSMHSALRDLSLNHLYVVYPGDETYSIHEKVTVIPLSVAQPI